MGRRKQVGVWAGLAAAVLMLAAGAGVRGEGWERAEGALNKAQGPIGKLVTLVLEDGKVKVDRTVWEGDEKKEAKEGDAEAGGAGGGGAAAAAKIRMGLAQRMGQKPVEKLLAEAAQAMGVQMRSATMGMDFRAMQWSGGPARMQLEAGGEAVVLRLQEVGDGARGLELSDDGAGSLRVMLTGDQGEMVFLQQTAKGGVSVVTVGGGKAQGRTAASWAALYRQDPAWMDKEVLGALRTVGVRAVLSPQDALVKGLVMGSLGAGDEAMGKKLLEDLNSEDFATRDQASKALQNEYAKYRELILGQAKAAGNPPEMAARLAAITAAHLDDNRLSAVVGAFDLTKDAGYLLGLLHEAKGTERAGVVSQLEKVTGQKFGDDEAAWGKWVEKK